MTFPESSLAHRYLDGLTGIEISASAHNPFGLVTRNVDWTAATDTEFKEEERRRCGRTAPVDIVAAGDDLPLGTGSVDFVISSHVIEHFWDPLRALKEKTGSRQKGNACSAALTPAVPGRSGVTAAGAPYWVVVVGISLTV